MSDIFTNSVKELKALVKDSEKSANKIFKACDKIVKEISKSKDAKLVEKVNTQISSIYEACHFQDFTGQRSSKVIKDLEYAKSKAGKIAPPKKSAYDKLKEGPALKAASQADIDKLFS